MRSFTSHLRLVIAGMLVLAPALGLVCDACCLPANAASASRISPADGHCPAHAGSPSAEPRLVASPHGCSSHALPPVGLRDHRLSSSNYKPLAVPSTEVTAAVPVPPSAHILLARVGPGSDTSPPGHLFTILRV